MKTLILNGSLKGNKELEKVYKYVEEILNEKSYEVEKILLHEQEIAPCLGCFGCWVKTPGVCVIDDYGRVLNEKIINSEMVVYITPVTYGGYSSELKKALDRIIPLILPFFKKVQGEVHHKERYEKYPKVVVLGMMDGEDHESEEIFNSLIKRNSLNWYNSFSGGIIQNNHEDIKGLIECILQGSKVKVC